MSYWVDRTLKQKEALFSKSEKEIIAQLAKEYQAASVRVLERLRALYDELLASAQDGTLLASDLYKYNRLVRLEKYLNGQLQGLGKKELKIMENDLLSLYKITSQMVGESIGFDVINPQMAKTAVQTIWCSDGQHWSNRVWRDKSALEIKLLNGLIDCVASGMSKDQMIREMMKTFSVGFSSASRIARTELTYIQNKATLDKFAEAGIKKYKFLATDDDRTCAEDRELNGQVFLLESALPGINFPPIHPNCRCSILGVVEQKEVS